MRREQIVNGYTPLRRNENDTSTINTHEGKADLFAERFFPNPQADMAALAAATQLPSTQFTVRQQVTSDEIKDILRNTKP
jgi:hypothetical protein